MVLPEMTYENAGILLEAGCGRQVTERNSDQELEYISER